LLPTTIKDLPLKVKGKLSLPASSKGQFDRNKDCCYKIALWHVTTYTVQATTQSK